MATIEKEYHLRQSSKPQNWTASQEKLIAKDFPFSDIALETPDQYVARTYLQFLWLPEVHHFSIEHDWSTLLNLCDSQ